MRISRPKSFKICISVVLSVGNPYTWTGNDCLRSEQKGAPGWTFFLFACIIADKFLIQHGGERVMIKNIVIVVIAIILWLAFIYDGNKDSAENPFPVFETPAGPERDAPVFSCLGKKFCSEMTSCEEARFAMRNCPDTELDPDGDGIPCEDLCTGY